MDRLINKEDVKWFTDLVVDLLSRSFRSGMEFDHVFGETKVIFTDLLKIDSGTKLYELVTD